MSTSHRRSSQLPIYQQIYAGLENSRSMYKPKDQKEAVDMVRESEGTYSFFFEEPTLEYIIQRQCDLKKIGGSIGPMRSFAIGLSKGIRHLSSAYIYQVLITKS